MSEEGIKHRYECWLKSLDEWCAKHKGITREQGVSLLFDDTAYNPRGGRDLVRMIDLLSWADATQFQVLFHQTSKETSDEKPRETCRCCGCPVANERDWDTYGEGEGNHLCWGPGYESMGCCDAETALDMARNELVACKDALAYRDALVQRLEKSASRWEIAISPQLALMLGSTLDPNDPMIDWIKECNRLADEILNVNP